MNELLLITFYLKFLLAYRFVATYSIDSIARLSAISNSSFSRGRLYIGILHLQGQYFYSSVSHALLSGGSVSFLVLLANNVGVLKHTVVDGS